MIIYVNNFEEAKNYPVMYGTSEVMFDSAQDKFYCKAVDNMGKPSMSTYEFTQVENEKPLTSADFVPKEQFDALNSKLDNLMMLLTQSAQPQPQTPPLEQTGPIAVSNIPQPNGPQPQPTVATTSRRNPRGGTNNAEQPNA